MKYRRLTPTGDYSFGQGKLEYLTDRKAVAQAIRTRLKLLQYEWWENLTEGLPLFERVLAARGSGQETAALIIRERILSTPHVTAVAGDSTDLTDGVFTFTAAVETDFGALQVAEEVGV